MAGYNVPQVNTRITPYVIPNYASELSRVMSGAFARPGVGGFGATQRTTKEERQAAVDQQKQLQAIQIIANDTSLQEKLNKLQTSPVAEQKATLQDIRRNDIRRIAETTGIDSNTLFNAMLGPIQSQVNARYKAVQQDAGSLSSLAGGLRMGVNEMLGAIKAIGKSDEEARAIGRNVAQENAAIRESSPYWQDQMLREQSGELITGNGETGSYLANIVRMLPQAAGAIGGTLGGAALGSAVTPGFGTIAGGVAGGGAVGAFLSAQDFINRVESDPRLTEEQKAEAIRTGRIPAAIIGGIANAIPINANPASQALLRATSGNIIGRVANKLGQTMAGRVLGNTLLSGAELALANTGDVLSRNVLYEQATGVDTPLTEGLGQALVQSAAMAPFFGAARTRTHGIPATERPTAAHVEATPTIDAPIQQAAQKVTPVVEGYKEIRTPEMVSFDESTRAGFYTGVENKTIDNVQIIYDAYVRDGRSINDFRNFLDADSASPTPLGEAIVSRLRQMIPDENIVRDLSGEEASFITSIKQRVLNGEDITPEQATQQYTGVRTGGKVFTDSIESTLLDGYKARNDLTTELYNAITKIGKATDDIEGEIAVEQFRQAIDRYFDAGGTDAVFNRFVEDAAKKKAERSVLSPAPGKLTKPQQSMLLEAYHRRQQEQSNVASSTTTDTNVGRNDRGGTTPVATPDIVSNSGSSSRSGTVDVDFANGIVRTVGESNGATQSGGLGGLTEPDQRANQANDVPVETARVGTNEQSDTGSGVRPATTTDAAAGESAGSAPIEGLRDAGATRDATYAGFDIQPNDGDIARALGTDVETVGRIVEEAGEVPRLIATEPIPFEAKIPNTPPIQKLLDSATAIRIDNELTAAMKKAPKDAAAHLNKYFESGGSQYQLNALLHSGKLSARDRLLIMRMIETTPEVKILTPNVAEVRGVLESLPVGAIKNPQTAMANLIRESLGEKLAPVQKRQVEALHKAGVPELVLPENLQQEVADAKMMGMEVSPEGLIESSADISETIQKITKQILCRAI